MKDLSTIDFSGDKLPILCTISVLEKIQTEFGSISAFSKKIAPDIDTKTQKLKLDWMPDIHAIAFVLPLLIDEGIEVYNEEHKIKLEKMTPDQLFRRCDQPLLTVSLAIYKELWRSINAPKQLPPEKTNQK